MKVLSAVLVAVLLVGCQGGKRTFVSSLTTKQDSISYMIGYNVQRNLGKDSIVVDYDAFVRGMNDASIDSSKRLLTMAKVDSLEIVLQADMRAKHMQAMHAEGEKNLNVANAFLAQNAKIEGVHGMSSGLQFKVNADGAGATPGATSEVTFQFRGTLLDGTEFDNTYKRGHPITVKMNEDGVPDGLKEGLKLMKKGSKWTLWIPPTIGFGEMGAPRAGIPPNSVVVMDVEIMSIK